MARFIVRISASQSWIGVDVSKAAVVGTPRLSSLAKRFDVKYSAQEINEGRKEFSQVEDAEAQGDPQKNRRIVRVRVRAEVRRDGWRQANARLNLAPLLLSLQERGSAMLAITLLPMDSVD